ncbi:MFS transporter [Natronorubrum sp. FCH18a]|uniref:MFS transporter n=1 Tax=Natronorubrum sp. FCH18a TaxID=3447018 RepID=UPI003F514D1B
MDSTSTQQSVRNRLASTINALWDDGKGMILLIISCGWFISLGIRIVYPALLPDIMAEFRIDYTSAGFLLSTIWITYASVQFPGGFLADRFGERAIVLTSLLAALGAILLIILAPIFAVFVLATVMLGLGTGLFGTSRVTILSDTYPDNRTTAVSFSQATGNLGNAILPVIAGFFAVAFGWRMGFGYLIPVFVLVVLGIMVYLPRRTSAAPDNALGVAYVKDLVQAVFNRTVLFATVMLFFMMFFYQGVTGFLPSYLIEVKGLSQTTASIVFGSFFATAIGFQFLSGLVSDRFGERRAIVLSVLIGLPPILLLPFLWSEWLIIPVAILSSATLGAVPPGHTYTVELMPDTLQGSGYGLVRTGYIGFGAISPPIVGFVADAGYFNFVFFLFAAAVICGALFCIRLPRVR